MRGVVIALVIMPLGLNCYSPSYKDCAITCTTDSCPSGLTCEHGMCRSSGASGTCSPVVQDATYDTPDSPVVPMDAAYPLGAWGQPQQVPLSLPSVVDPSLTPDMLQLFVMHANVLYFATRQTTADSWTPLQPVPNVSAVGEMFKDQTPSISSDGLTLMFNTTRTPSVGLQDLYMSTRASGSGAWTTPTEVVGLNSTADDSGENMSFDQKTIVFGSSRNDADNTLDIFMSTRADTGASWSTPVALDSLNVSGINDGHPCISPDLLTIYFQTARAGSTDLYWSHRDQANDPFPPPTAITELDNGSDSQGDPWVSPDGHHMYFSSDQGSGVLGVWETSR